MLVGWSDASGSKQTMQTTQDSCLAVTGLTGNLDGEAIGCSKMELQ